MAAGVQARDEGGDEGSDEGGGGVYLLPDGPALFRYEDAIEDPTQSIYFACTLLTDLSARLPVGVTAGYHHCPGACRAGTEIGQICESKARLAGYDDANVQLLDLFMTPRAPE